jgi:hypothetical protein
VQPSQSTTAQSGPATVSNAAAQPENPSVQRASTLRKIAETLAGGPRYKTTIDPQTGQTTRTQVPLSRGDIGMAIVAEVLGGAMSGLSVKNGPGNLGRATAAGFSNAQEQQQQAQQAQQQQTQQDLANQSAAFARAAQIHEVNSRTLLNTSELEQRGADAIDKAVAINRESGVLDADLDNVLNGGTPLTQAELLDQMSKGIINTTAQLGPIAGRVEVTNPDGTKRWEATHLILKDPNTKVTISQDQWDRYAAAGVPGFSPNLKLGPDGAQMKLSMVQRANEITAAHYLANQRLSDLRNTLDGTPFADKVPASVDWSVPGTETAVQRFQRYVSHDSANAADPYLALQAMGANRRDPKTGELQPNPDARYVDAAASAMGGWNVLEAAHNQLLANRQNAEKFSIIDSADKAQAVLAAPKRFSADQVSAARGFMAVSQQLGESKAASEARARAVAEGKDTEAMYKTGINPISHVRLGLDNAPDSMFVDATGHVVPLNQQPFYKPSAQERQTADTARQVLSITQDLQNQVSANPALIGPLAGRSKEGLAKLGLGDAQAQKLLDDVSLLQSAVTKMHTGRFSNEVLQKSGNLIKPDMNPDQFSGALSSIRDVANRYALEDRLITVADYKAMQQAPATVQPMNRTQTQPSTQPSGEQPAQRVVPAGAVPGRDAAGNIIGYRLNGQTVRF